MKYPEEILRERIAKLEAENERLREDVKDLTDELDTLFEIVAQAIAGKAEQ